MAKFAQISGNVVANIVIGDSKEELESLFGGEFVEYTEENPAGVGWFFDKETGEFTNPFVPEVIEE